MVFTEQQLQVKKLVDVQQDIEIDALNDGVGALSSTMQNGFTEAANNFSDIQNSLGLMNSLSDERYNGLTGSINALSNAMTQGFLDMGNTIVNTTETIQGQLNQMNANTGNMNDNIQNQFNDVNSNIANSIDNYNANIQNQFNIVNYTFEQVNNDVATAIYNIWDTCNNMNASIANSVTTNLLTANNIVIDVSAAPVNSTAALGYDINGKIIPITTIVNTNITFPPNANYLYTDAAGTPYAGMADTVVSTNENLVTSHAVYNAVNDIWTDLNEFHNEVSNAFGDVQNSFNAVDSTFAGVQNQFNDVNNNFNGVQNQFNDVRSSAIDPIDALIMNLYPVNGYNSSSPVDYRNVEHIVYGTVSASGTSVGNAKIEFNSTTNTLTVQPVLGIDKYCFNTNMTSTFSNCHNLNQNIQIPYGVTKMGFAFSNCNNLNQNILIPNSVTFMSNAFLGCTSLNQNIQIPYGVTNISCVFYRCTSLNQDIYMHCDFIGTELSRFAMESAFFGCTLLATRNIHIRNTIPMDTSNNIYNALVNNYTGVNWAGRIYNDL